VAEDVVTVHVEWIDADGEKTVPLRPYFWPVRLELPKIGDQLDWAIFAPCGCSAEVVGRRWIMGSKDAPDLLLTCDLGIAPVESGCRG